MKPGYWATASDHDTCTAAVRAALVRHIFGNPFQPTWGKVTCRTCGGNGWRSKSDPHRHRDCSDCSGLGFFPRLRPDLPRVVLELAEACFNLAGERVACKACGGSCEANRGDRAGDLVCRSCSGHGSQLSPQPTSPLHDALELCGEPELAEHFREDGWHPRGCWVIDAILEKE